MTDNEELLLAVLNSAPVVRGVITDGLDGVAGAELARRHGGSGADHELTLLRRVRAALQSAVRGNTATAIDELSVIVEQAEQVPRVTAGGVAWELRAPADSRLPVNVVLAWSAVTQRFPGRLRACANEECNLFLLDHSRPGTARWCSMSTCGNRMKARAHATRLQTSHASVTDTEDPNGHSERSRT